MKSINISISKTLSEKVVNFNTDEISFSQLPEITSKIHYSPTIFKDGYRKNVNFERVEVLVLDIDDGLSIEDVKQKLQGFKAIITTTKSH